MKTSFALAFVISALLPTTLAHGFVRWVEINGKRYNGPQPWQKSGSSGIRRVDNTTPVLLKHGADVACGHGAANRGAKLTLPANPGDKIVFRWDSGDKNSNWPHDSGPIIDWLGKCSAEGCDKTDGTKVNFFKIGSRGKKPNQGNKWYQEDMKKGWNPSVTLPKDLPAGNYLLRHEIIALHLADRKGGVEDYPACIQIKVGGNNSGSPDRTVKFPGAYKADDPSLLIHIWNTAKKAYKIPGPAIVKFTGSGQAAQPAPVPAPAKAVTDKKASEAGKTETKADGKGKDVKCKRDTSHMRRRHHARRNAARTERSLD